MFITLPRLAPLQQHPLSINFTVALLAWAVIAGSSASVFAAVRLSGEGPLTTQSGHSRLLIRFVQE
jgi:hypothetical protein